MISFNNALKYGESLELLFLEHAEGWEKYSTMFCDFRRINNHKTTMEYKADKMALKTGNYYFEIISDNSKKNSYGGVHRCFYNDVDFMVFGLLNDTIYEENWFEVKELFKFVNDYYLSVDKSKLRYPKSNRNSSTWYGTGIPIKREIVNKYRLFYKKINIKL